MDIKNRLKRINDDAIERVIMFALFDEDNSVYEISKSIQHVILNCSEGEMAIANKMLIAILGLDIESLLNLAEKDQTKQGV